MNWWVHQAYEDGGFVLVFSWAFWVIASIVLHELAHGWAAIANGDGTPEDHVMTLVDSELLDELLGTLDARARFAVESRFGLVDGERKSFREVGEQLGVTAEAARRLVSRAVAGLRDDAERILAV